MFAASAARRLAPASPDPSRLGYARPGTIGGGPRPRCRPPRARERCRGWAVACGAVHARPVNGLSGSPSLPDRAGRSVRGPWSQPRPGGTGGVPAPWLPPAARGGDRRRGGGGLPARPLRPVAGAV